MKETVFDTNSQSINQSIKADLYSSGSIPASLSSYAHTPESW